MRPAPKLPRLLVVALVVLLPALAGCTPPQSCQLFILAGQSNMVGRGEYVDLPPGERDLPPNVRLYEASFDWNLQPVQDRLGPEYGLAHTLGPAYADQTLVLVKYAVEASSLLDWSPEWSRERAALTGNPDLGPLYQGLLNFVAQAQADVGQDCPVAAVFWMQGERDARFPQAAELYQPNLEALVRRLRADLDAPRLPFLLGQVNPPPDEFPAVETVRQAQVAVAEQTAHTYLVSTEGLSKRRDGLHYDLEGQIGLGRRFARAFLELAGP